MLETSDALGECSSIYADLYNEINCEQQELMKLQQQKTMKLQQQKEDEQTQMEAQVTVEKRSRRESEEGTEFTVVQTRKKAKRRLPKQHENDGEKQGYEVNITSTQILLKQIAFAKLLKAENIQNILSIKYKNPYKLIITFQDKESADTLINSKKLEELEYRCQPRWESKISYGVVKEIDLDINETELMENFTCEYEIITMKRMKRLDEEENKWIDSEAVRVGFLTNEAPPYVFAYGTRFKVYPYTFPVSQCSKCWKFGHLSRACSTKKKVCPLCGENHENCDKSTYQCVNCGGPHKAFDRNCSKFIKEKEIRLIMRAENVSYKQALDIYVDRQKEDHNKETERYYETEIDSSEELVLTNETSHNSKSYRDVLVTTALVHEQKKMTKNKDKTPNVKANVQKTTKNKKNKQGNDNNLMDYDVYLSKEALNHDENVFEPEGQTEVKKKKFNIRVVFRRIQEMVMSEDKLEDKIYAVLKLIVFEVIQVFKDYIDLKDIMSKLLSLIVNG